MADLRELAGVIVPVVVEQRTDVHRNRDLIGPHELLEERDARLALESPFLESVNVGEHSTALSVERLSELPERHLPALLVEVGVPGKDLDERIIALCERAEDLHGVKSRLEEQMREHLARGPLARRIGALHVCIHSLELA